LLGTKGYVVVVVVVVVVVSKWRSNVGSLLTNWLTCIAGAAQHYFCFLIVTYVLINFSVGSLLTN
jgi:hypothetical protein